MTTKTYTEVGNCVRAARAALGKAAERNVHFHVTTHEDGSFSWSPVEGAPPVPETAAPKATRAPKVPKTPRESRVRKAKAPAAPKAAKAKAAKAKAPKEPRIKTSLIDRKANQEILKLMQRKNGVSAEEVTALGKMTATSYRGLASLMRKEIDIIDIIKPGEPRRHHWNGRRRGAT